MIDNLKMNTTGIKHLAITALSAFALSFCAFGQNSNTGKLSTPEKEPKNVTIVKLSPIVFAGNRYVVKANFGLKKSVPLMIHGNARFYLMITRDIAEQLNNGKPIKKISDYGYSDKGKGSITVEKFQVGDKTFTNEQMEIGVAVNDQPDKNLLAQGYSYTKFFVENGEGYMNVYFDSLKNEVPITVGTVADAYSLDLVTFQNGIELEATDSKDHSPGGTTPKIFLNAAPIKYKIADQSFEIPRKKADLHSFAEYEKVKQSELFPLESLAVTG